MFNFKSEKQKRIEELEESLEKCRDLFREIELYCNRDSAHDGQVLIDETLN